MKVTYRKGTLYFDNEAADLIRQAAKRLHQSPRMVVIRAIRRGVRLTKGVKK